jgi:hypothetical protein
MQARTSTSTPVYFKEQQLALRHSTGATAAGRAAVFGRTAVTPRFDYGDGGGLQVVCGGCSSVVKVSLSPADGGGLQARLRAGSAGMQTDALFALEGVTPKR